MDRVKERRIWWWSVAVGFAALLASAGGQVFAAGGEPDACGIETHVADRAVERLGSAFSAPSVVQHIARAALSLVAERCE